MNFGVELIYSDKHNLNGNKANHSQHRIIIESHLPFWKEALTWRDWLEYAELADDISLVETTKAVLSALDKDETLLWPATKVKPQTKAHKVNNLNRMAVKFEMLTFRKVDLAFFTFIRDLFLVGVSDVASGC